MVGPPGVTRGARNWGRHTRHPAPRPFPLPVLLAMFPPYTVLAAQPIQPLDHLVELPAQHLRFLTQPAQLVLFVFALNR
jgi:hypothetical protein